jgi:hypothetical protein
VDAVANRTTARLTRTFRREYFGAAVLDDGPRYVFKGAAPPDAIRIIEASGIRSTIAEGLGLNLPEAIEQQSAFSRALARHHLTCDSMVPLPSDLSWHVSCDQAQVDMAEVRRLAAQHLREAPIVFDDSTGGAGPASGIS